MNAHRRFLAWTLALTPLAASAGGGLTAPAPETLWPQWQARITVQTAALSPLSAARLLDGGVAPRGWQGASVLGDYYFASPSFGSFRASGGLMTGLQGGAPSLSAAAGPRLGLGVQSGAHTAPTSADGPATVPYLGFGFSGAALGNALSVTADVGLVAERPGASLGLGRALFGNQGLDAAMRDLRLAPVLQLGVRYTF
ncbi:conserved exported hypothetical protein [Rubrivivax sp. A210]|uniref:hypothetical protein n=1 Tax=Rubrivivax sp. A210 TaxID=2772301 RepID=UPI001919FBAE|nr:hypothetical protein [Rubrivivax sp. A210]CAD5374156.1 conserved exported hypothetical protein [Rubrivivax sp. A210]